MITRSCKKLGCFVIIADGRKPAISDDNAEVSIKQLLNPSIILLVQHTIPKRARKTHLTTILYYSSPIETPSYYVFLQTKGSYRPVSNAQTLQTVPEPDA
jgi:hypothetical protein